MIKIKGIDKIKNFVQKVGKNIFKKPAYLFLFLFLIDLVIGGVLFWQIIFSPKNGDSQPQSLLVLDKNALDKVVQGFADQEKDFQKNDIQVFPDIFVGFVEVPVSPISFTPSFSTSSASSTQNQ